MKFNTFLVVKSSIDWAKFDLQNILLFHFLFWVFKRKNRTIFSLFSLKIIKKISLCLLLNETKNTLISFCFRFFISLQIFSLPFRFKCFHSVSISLWILRFVSFLVLLLSMMFLLYLMLLSTINFRYSEALDPCYFVKPIYKRWHVVTVLLTVLFILYRFKS